MNGNCHFVFGAAVGTALTLNMGLLSSALTNITPTPETATLLVLGGIMGGIFPDIDNPVSYMGKMTVPLSTGLGMIGKAMGKAGKNHRGVLHDPLTYLVGLFLCYQYFIPLVGFFVGCLSHLFLDMFNPSGIPFLLGVKRLRIGKIVSGSKESIIFTWVCVGVVLVAGIALSLGYYL
jgi:membrane-bound metal-dependent hydrolase YbcI (DUF457 family)